MTGFVIENKISHHLRAITINNQQSTMAIRPPQRASTMVDRSESDTISSNPIKLGLKSFRHRFRLRCSKLGILESLDASAQVELWFGEGSSGME